MVHTMNKPIARRYIYTETYKKIMMWGFTNDIPTPNNKPNFPSYLAAYIDYLEHK